MFFFSNAKSNCQPHHIDAVFVNNIFHQDVLSKDFDDIATVLNIF